MICPRGSICTESTHEVKTLSAAKEWLDGISDAQQPIKVNVHTASGGRNVVKIFDCNNDLIFKRG